MPEKNNSAKNTSFGKIMLASGVGTLIVLIVVGLFKLFALLGIIGGLSSTATPPIPKNAFLKIDLTKAFPERSPDELETWVAASSPVGFVDLLRAISNAADDNNIKGIYLYLGSGSTLSWGKSEELRHTLAHFCESDKPILAYADNYNQQGYFVASVSDSIFLNPSGMLEFRGIGAESLFYKELLDKLAVHMTLVRPQSNNFKSAGETYTMNHLSDANRTQIREYIQSIWDYAIEQIAEARDISTDDLNSIADNLAAFLPDDAVSNSLIDRLCFESDIVSTMSGVYGSDKTVSIDEYCKSLANKRISAKDKIAVIYAEGEVVPGTGIGTAVYSDKITQALNDAAADSTIKAIVLRVNSPGGSVVASEIMTDAVARAKQKKPVVVSMGDVAASAGYEISCNATTIIAEPTTLTGSIGVFATIPEVGGTLKRFLGITTDTVKTNANATSLSILRPLSPKALELLQRNVEDFYSIFVARVANGRGLDAKYVDSIARGRVWTGRDALKLGLVDALGGIDDAISIAAEAANIDNYRVIDFPPSAGLLNDIIEYKNNSSGTAKAQTFDPSANGHCTAPAQLFGDGVWVDGGTMASTLCRICDTRGLQARVEFFIITE